MNHGRTIEILVGAFMARASLRYFSLNEGQ